LSGRLAALESSEFLDHLIAEKDAQRRDYDSAIGLLRLVQRELERLLGPVSERELSEEIGSLARSIETGRRPVDNPDSFELDQPAHDKADEGLYTREEYEAGRASAEEIAYLHMARAWIDRWKALGGSFGMVYTPDGRPDSLLRSMTMALETWDRPDKGREDIPPHTWIIEDRHHDGAVKVLEGLLELTPGLREAVREIGGRETLARWAQGQEA
jgi:hypothetical protein